MILLTPVLVVVHLCLSPLQVWVPHPTRGAAAAATAGLPWTGSTTPQQPGPGGLSDENHWEGGGGGAKHKGRVVDNGALY